MKKIILFYSIIICVVACTKVDQRSMEKRMESFSGFAIESDSPTIYNCVMVTSDQVANPLHGKFQVSAVASFSDSTTGAKQTATSISIGNRTIASNPDSTFSFEYNGPDSTEGRSLPGSTLKIRIVGSASNDTVTKEVYMPKDVVRSLSDFPNGIVNKGNDVVLNWVSDPNNSPANVIIQVYYYRGMSLHEDSTFPQNINKLQYIVADNGSYTIPSADLQAFPVGSYIGIALGRGTQTTAILPVSQRRVFYYAISSASTTPLLVKSCNSSTCAGNNKKCIEGNCVVGEKVYTSSVWDPGPRKYFCTYHYEWPDGSTSQDYTEIKTTPCPILVE